MKKVTVGLTGGICSGKSTVSSTIIKNNIPIVDADIIARQVVEIGTAALQSIANTFGVLFLNIDGSLNRTALSKHVFSNLNELQKLDVLMKPFLIAEATKQINDLHSKGHEIVIFDAALIVEMGYQEQFRPLIVVHCPFQTQLERLMKRNQLSEIEAMSRINAQLPVEQKIKFADYTIDTSKDISYSISQTLEIIKQLKEL